MKPKQVDFVVCARHVADSDQGGGRELAGCNAPARELKGIHDYECYQKNRPKARAPLRGGLMPTVGVLNRSPVANVRDGSRHSVTYKAQSPGEPALLRMRVCARQDLPGESGLKAVVSAQAVKSVDAMLTLFPFLFYVCFSRLESNILILCKKCPLHF